MEIKMVEITEIVSIAIYTELYVSKLSCKVLLYKYYSEAKMLTNLANKNIMF